MCAERKIYNRCDRNSWPELFICMHLLKVEPKTATGCLTCMSVACMLHVCCVARVASVGLVRSDFCMSLSFAGPTLHVQNLSVMHSFISNIPLVGFMAWPKPARLDLWHGSNLLCGMAQHLLCWIYGMAQTCAVPFPAWPNLRIFMSNMALTCEVSYTIFP